MILGGGHFCAECVILAGDLLFAFLAECLHLLLNALHNGIVELLEATVQHFSKRVFTDDSLEKMNCLGEELVIVLFMKVHRKVGQIKLLDKFAAGEFQPLESAF